MSIKGGCCQHAGCGRLRRGVRGARHAQRTSCALRWRRRRGRRDAVWRQCAVGSIRAGPAVSRRPKQAVESRAHRAPPRALSLIPGFSFVPRWHSPSAVRRDYFEAHIFLSFFVRERGNRKGPRCCRTSDDPPRSVEGQRRDREAAFSFLSAFS